MPPIIFTKGQFPCPAPEPTPEHSNKNQDLSGFFPGIRDVSSLLLGIIHGLPVTHLAACLDIVHVLAGILVYTTVHAVHIGAVGWNSRCGVLRGKSGDRYGNPCKKTPEKGNCNKEEDKPEKR